MAEQNSRTGKTRLENLIEQAENFGNRPVEKWNPPYCGVVDIRILRDGNWMHEGRPIRRPALVALFSSILRREADGHHYIVTPVEKLRIHVEDAAHLAVELFPECDGPERRLGMRTNLGQVIVAGPRHPLRFEIESPGGGLKPYVGLERGLEALFARALVPELADLIEERTEEDGRIRSGIASDGAFFPLPEAAL